MNTCVRRLLTGALIALALNPVAIYSQALNPTYLAHMPAPVRVLELIKGKDAGKLGPAERALLRRQANVQCGKFVSKHLSLERAWAPWYESLSFEKRRVSYGGHRRSAARKRRGC